MRLGTIWHYSLLSNSLVVVINAGRFAIVISVGEDVVRIIPGSALLVVLVIVVAVVYDDDADVEDYYVVDGVVADGDVDDTVVDAMVLALDNVLWLFMLSLPPSAETPI